MPASFIKIEQLQIGFKDGVVAATQSDIADLGAGAPDTVDGVSLSVGDRVLVYNQSTASENGIYEVVTVGTGANGAWIRVEDVHDDDDEESLQSGTVVFVRGGTVDGKRGFILTTTGTIDVGVTGQTWERLSDTDTGVTEADIVENEVVTCAAGGTSCTALANVPSADSTVKFYRNGQRLVQGAANDYTIASDTITLTKKARSGDNFLVDYRK